MGAGYRRRPRPRRRVLAANRIPRGQRGDGRYATGGAGAGGARYPATERLRFYFVALALVVLFFLLYKRFVSSPVGRVCVAIRENEDRALMLGYNTFLFKLAALTLSSMTAAVAGIVHCLNF